MEFLIWPIPIAWTVPPGGATFGCSVTPGRACPSGGQPGRRSGRRWRFPGGLVRSGRVRSAVAIDTSTTPGSTEALSIRAPRTTRVPASGAVPDSAPRLVQGVTGGTWNMADRRRSGAHVSGVPSPDADSRPAAEAGSAVESGSSTSTASRPAKMPPSQAQTHSDPATRATFRLLLLRGLAPDEAANLTAYLCGLPVHDARWTLGEINRLLFLRDLSRSGRWGLDDGVGRRLH